MQKIHLIDSLGPFIEKNTNDEIINWSKINFSTLEENGHLHEATVRRITYRFTTYLEHVVRLGYDSISVDDLAHLVNLPFYHPNLRELLKEYAVLYQDLFSIAKKHGVRILITTDYLFHNDDIDKYLHDNNIKLDDFFMDIISTAIHEFPEIDGIIMRMGENDGMDVKNAFLSRLSLRSPRQARKLLKKILPLFEQHNKLLIFRTWTVGVYTIGDLIWNEKTFDTIFSSIESEALIISMKFGDTDFMRYLPLNPLFLRGSHYKIAELQTRREWEGMGIFPSFVGWDYYEYLNELSKNETVIGIHVWCQTGGWAKREWTNITYLQDSSYWNELNTEVTIDMYRRNLSPETAIEIFCQKRHIKSVAEFTKLLTLSEIAIKNGLYIPDLAQQSLYFRRTRVPSLIWLTWDKVMLQPWVIYFLRLLIVDKDKAVRDANRAVGASKEMVAIAEGLQLDEHVVSSLSFEYATLTLFAKLRRYILFTTSSEETARLNNTIAAYTSKYPQHYTVPKLRKLSSSKRRIPKRLIYLFLRESRLYRRRDKILLKTSLLQRKIIGRYLKRTKSELTDQSMGIEVIFK